MRICVVSDCHFKYHTVSAADHELNDTILAFFRSIVGEYDLLVLNGDIFDLWFDWHYCIIRQYFPLLKCFADIAEKGCEIVYISGNHDFWFGDFFPETLGIKIAIDGYSLTVDGKRMLFTHGDKYTVNDLRYKIFRSIIRLRFPQRIFALLHPDLALWVGASMSRSSRKRKSPPALRQKKTAGLESHAAAQLKKGYDLVAMGHSHQPCLKHLENGIYANSGDWLKHRTFIKIIDGIAGLHTFDTSPS
ncbi:MAG: UDP-2,3-diacylglucosamine diphosphatase [Candidatus Cloacimonadaceae bacterium]|nr:UDP-2,3-diacylglucosamine diphosphatase [Candidatus Cloacimonadaceae bacterium]